MVILKIIGALYLIGGLFYAIYITLIGVSKWTNIPINTLGGPLVLLVNYFRAKKGKLGPGIRNV